MTILTRVEVAPRLADRDRFSAPLTFAHGHDGELLILSGYDRYVFPTGPCIYCDCRDNYINDKGLWECNGCGAPR